MPMKIPYSVAFWLSPSISSSTSSLPISYILLQAAGGGGPHPNRVVSGGSGGRTVLADNDENKYKRKNPMEMVSRWFK